MPREDLTKRTLRFLKANAPRAYGKFVLRRFALKNYYTEEEVEVMLKNLENNAALIRRHGWLYQYDTESSEEDIAKRQADVDWFNKLPETT